MKMVAVGSSAPIRVGSGGRGCGAAVGVVSSVQVARVVLLLLELGNVPEGTAMGGACEQVLPRACDVTEMGTAPREMRGDTRRCAPGVALLHELVDRALQGRQAAEYESGRASEG